MEKTERTVAELILDQLHIFGVKRIYGVVGDAIIGLIDALASQDKIKFIAVKHESTAAFMASAEAKLTGGLGVCTATMGPGVTNLLNGLGDAYSDKAPVLAITGQAPRNKIGTDFQQYVDQQELVKPFAAYSANLASQDAIIELLQKAAQTSLGQRTVTHLSIPKDLFEKLAAVKPRQLPTVIEGDSTTFKQESLEQAAAIMKTAKRPMILAGAGSAAASKAIEELADLWGAGILTSLGGKGVFSDSSPNLLQGIGEGGNPYASEVFKEADVVLLAGVTWWPDGYVPKDARIIQIDNNPDKIGKSIPTELGVIGEAGEVIPPLKESLKSFTPNTDWLTRRHEIKEKWAEQNEREGNTPGSPIYPSRIVRAIERTVAADAILTLDTGDVTVWMNRNFRQNNQTVLFSGYWRTMGFGLPAAIAAKLASPERQVVAVVGDGGLEMVLADLLTATRYNLNITVVVFNNEALQMERDKIKAAGEKEIGVDLTNPDFVKIAEACGWRGFSADTDAALESALAEALNTASPALVDVRTAQAFFPETE
ncbi:thiamine pyrophosphate-binding protein [Bacillus aerolatus]|uniref:Thiamine pyrophosphate-binding protein n=1 Tax=Bacillus aerolatus TaxID=2653354 RepID=A0A6I1FEK0_9BACI|nr:thiamine pyrophosphate-binding protein [Bacillus aerolatus]KAB7706182.1 thiamine pyrophosphate-binding protein [Bacillus aerolatus]